MTTFLTIQQARRRRRRSDRRMPDSFVDWPGIVSARQDRKEDLPDAEPEPDLLPVSPAGAPMIAFAAAAAADVLDAPPDEEGMLQAEPEEAQEQDEDDEED